jgi:hypothetical protein
MRLVVRSLRRAPGFAVTAILTLALGVGLATAVFTVADALLLRRLPVRDQDQLVTLWGATADGSFANVPLRIQEAREFARRTRALESLAFFAYEGAWPQPVRGESYGRSDALGTGVLLLSICMLASLIPARSSTRIDPMVALRAEG